MMRNRFSIYFFRRFEFNASERGFTLSKVYSMRAPTRPASRGNGLRLLRRAAQKVLQALRDSRQRTARKIIEDYRRQNRE